MHVVTITSTKTENKSFLVYEDTEENRSTNKDGMNIINAIPTTTNKFGPSGSLKNKNITREQMSDVMASIVSEIF